MKPFYILLTGVSLFSLISAHADPLLLEENPSSTYTFASEEKEHLSSPSLDQELALLDEEMEEFEDEILALEEELKRDAESFNEFDKQEGLTSESQVAQTDVLKMANSAEEVAPSTLLEAPSHEIVSQPKLDETALQAVSSAPTELTSSELSTQSAQELIPADVGTSPLKVEEPVLPHLSENKQVALIDELPQSQEASAVIQIDANRVEKKNDSAEVNIQQAFAGSPVIYTILLGMSVFAVSIWLYSLISLKRSGNVSEVFLKNLRNKLNSNHFDDALSLCQHHENLISKMVASGINARRHGLPIMIEAMKTEGKRASVHFWQRIGLLNDIAIIAPMLGLLGTVLGMFYAFYDINRSIESITTLFDGLGVSVGTTVAGLIVAILSLILHSVAKYRLVKVLAHVENEAQAVATIIDDRIVEYKG